MKLLREYKEAFSQMPAEIREAEAEVEKEAELTVELLNGERSGTSSSDITEVFVRATGEKTGFTYTQCLEEDPLSVIKRAFESGLYAQGKPQPMCDGKEFQQEIPEPEQPVSDLETLWEKAFEIDTWIQKQQIPISSRHISVTDRVRTVGITNSKGHLAQSSRHTYTVIFRGVYEGKTKEECKKEYTFTTLEAIKENCLEDWMERWKRRLMEPVCAHGGIYPCLLDRSVMINLFMTGWQMFSGAEAAEGNSPLGSPGEKAASVLVTIADKPLVQESGYQFLLDCEGSRARERQLIEKGMLKGFLHNLNSAQKTGQESTGNAGRKVTLGGGIPTEIRVTPKNFCMEPGNSTFDEMIAGINEGFYIYESFDTFHSVHFSSGEFSIPCNGIYIRNGKMEGIVKGLTISGTVMNLLLSVKAVGSERDFASLTMMHSYTIGMPDVLVGEITVSA